MAEEYHYKEVRKSERGAVVKFAQLNGFSFDADALRHTLSLVAEADGQIVAVALCLGEESGRVTLEIVTSDQGKDQALITELADRCLRKVQAKDIAAARIHSPEREPTDTIWTSANWLDRIEETPPPQAPADPEAPSQAA